MLHHFAEQPYATSMCGVALWLHDFAEMQKRYGSVMLHHFSESISWCSVQVCIVLNKMYYVALHLVYDQGLSLKNKYTFDSNQQGPALFFSNDAGPPSNLPTWHRQCFSYSSGQESNLRTSIREREVGTCLFNLLCSALFLLENHFQTYHKVLLLNKNNFKKITLIH